MPCRATASGRSARGSTATSPNRSTFAPSPRKSAATSARMRRLPQVDAAVHGGDAHFSPAGAEFALQMLPELPGHDERIVGLARPQAHAPGQANGEIDGDITAVRRRRLVVLPGDAAAAPVGPDGANRDAVGDLDGLDVYAAGVGAAVRLHCDDLE